MLFVFEKAKCQWRALRNVVFWVVALFFLTACSSVKLAYNQLDRLVLWQVTDEIDLNAQQRSDLRQSIRAYKAWHREQALPVWANTLEDFIADIQQPISLQQLNNYEQVANNAFNLMLERAMPFAVDWLRELDAKQVDQLAQAMRKRNAEQIEEFAGKTPEQQSKQWLDERQDQLEDWVGRLSTQQVQMLSDLSDKLGSDTDAWMSYRESWQQDFIGNFTRVQQPLMFAERLRELMLERERWYSDSYRESRALRQQAFRDFAVSFINSLSDTQRQSLQDRLSRYAEDFRELSGQALIATSDSASSN